MAAPRCTRLHVWQPAWHLIPAVGWGTELMCCASRTWLKYSYGHARAATLLPYQSHVLVSSAWGHEEARYTTWLWAVCWWWGWLNRNLVSFSNLAQHCSLLRVAGPDLTAWLNLHTSCTHTLTLRSCIQSSNDGVENEACWIIYKTCMSYRDSTLLLLLKNIVSQSKVTLWLQIFTCNLCLDSLDDDVLSQTFAFTTSIKRGLFVRENNPDDIMLQGVSYF